MNIFHLHKDPVICAEMHIDKHVVKMPIEYAWVSILISCISAAIISSIWLIFELKKLKKV